MYVLGLDLETNGLDSQTDEIIEIGAVLWSVEEAKPVKMLSHLVRPNQPVPAEITEITGISQKDVDEQGVELSMALADLKIMAEASDYIVAHNGQGFDQKFMQKAFLAYPEMAFERPWIDTMFDLPFPKSVGTRKLDYLAAEHGFINPFSHRALFDVLTMLKIFSKYDFDRVLALHQSPLLRVVAKVSFDERGKAKDQGFRWDPQQKQWYLDMKKMVFEEQEFPFSTRLVENP